MLKAGLIGYGYWGPNLARNLADADDDIICLAAVADARPERRQSAERRHPGVKTYADADALIGSSDVDAVVIATPLATHTPLAEAAIEHGKHVLVEKPLAASRKDAEFLAELAEKRGVCLMVDHTFVYTGAVRKIRSLIDAGDLGQLLYLDSVRVNLGLFQQDSNVIWDLAVHDLSVMDHLIDARPVAVSADGSCVAGYRHENIAYITVHFDNGVLAHFHVNWLAPVKIRHMLLGGSQRMLVFNDMEPSEKVLVYDKGVDVNLGAQDDQTRRQVLVSYRTGDMYAPKLDRTEALAGVVREFARAVAEKRAPMTDAASGIRVVSLLEAAEQSLREEGRRIRL
jgi:predicted dehydrogenase